MKKTKESIEYKWKRKWEILEKTAQESNLRIIADYRRRWNLEIEAKIDKLKRKQVAYLRKKKLEYDRKCKNEIRLLEWKEVKVYKIKSKTRNQRLQFALEIAQENARLRDTDKSGNWVCCSCWKVKSWWELAWWHRYSRKVQWICLWSENINAQCHYCNWATWPKGNTIEKERVNMEYDKYLVEKYWEDRINEMVDHMKKYYGNPLKYTPTDIFVRDYIPDLLDENERLWKTKDFYKPKKQWRKQWNEIYILK